MGLEKKISDHFEGHSAYMLRSNFVWLIFRDTFGVVVGLLKSGVKTCVPQLSTIKTEFSRELKTIY